MSGIKKNTEYEITTVSGVTYKPETYKNTMKGIEFTITEKYYDYGIAGTTTKYIIPYSSIQSIKEIKERF